MKEEIVYFELDNWFYGRDYPASEPFSSWMEDDHLQSADDNWCKENKLCVEAGAIDMSVCFCVTAPKSWVEANCPKLLTDEECGAYFTITRWDKEKQEQVSEKKYESCKYSKFICKPDEDGYVYGRLSGWKFREYKEENFGVHWSDLRRDDDE